MMKKRKTGPWLPYFEESEGESFSFESSPLEAEFYCKHNRQKDGYGNFHCLECEIELLHKDIAQLQNFISRRLNKYWKEKAEKLEQLNKELRREINAIREDSKNKIENKK